MKAAVATKWVKALRSKKYKQGKLALKVKTKAGITKHCCLGVLCELYQRENPDKKMLTARRKTKEDDDLARGTTIFGFGTKEDICESNLPNKVCRWAGIKTDDGWFSCTRVKSDKYLDSPSLVEMNDGGMSFERIANVIEEHFKAL